MTRFGGLACSVVHLVRARGGGYLATGHFVENARFGTAQGEASTSTVPELVCHLTIRVLEVNPPTPSASQPLLAGTMSRLLRLFAPSSADQAPIQSSLPPPVQDCPDRAVFHIPTEVWFHICEALLPDDALVYEYPSPSADSTPTSVPYLQIPVLDYKAARRTLRSLAFASKYLRGAALGMLYRVVLLDSPEAAYCLLRTVEDTRHREAPIFCTRHLILAALWNWHLEDDDARKARPDIFINSLIHLMPNLRILSVSSYMSPDVERGLMSRKWVGTVAGFGGPMWFLWNWIRGMTTIRSVRKIHWDIRHICDDYSYFFPVTYSARFLTFFPELQTLIISDRRVHSNAAAIPSLPKLTFLAIDREVRPVCSSGDKSIVYSGRIDPLLPKWWIYTEDGLDLAVPIDENLNTINTVLASQFPALRHFYMDASWAMFALPARRPDTLDITGKLLARVTSVSIRFTPPDNFADANCWNPGTSWWKALPFLSHVAILVPFGYHWAPRIGTLPVTVARVSIVVDGVVPFPSSNDQYRESTAEKQLEETVSSLHVLWTPTLQVARFTNPEHVRWLRTYVQMYARGGTLSSLLKSSLCIEDHAGEPLAIISV
ncbi:hypothetical protein K488DRAFT_72683 [Vararia minispora EC-137]|uniref:Uncharacterized protein n=1 Tax=Vararia minispora EC-137 TaxID=1314806 RepID=A0ACB8QDX9_9AGAM|nr:hypothetical protein K488DRAFT_72683 [Vararia minispora EC-137]